MQKIVLSVSQSLETVAPSDKDDIENAVLTIEDPEPYLEEEAFEMEFHSDVKSADAQVKDGQLIATRELVFSLNILDEAAASEWLCDEQLLKEGEGLLDADWTTAISHLVGDYEGAFIADDMVNFETSVSVVD